MATARKKQQTGSKNTEVTKTSGKLPGDAIPSFLQKGQAGKEHLGQADVELPQLKLLQGTTPGLNENGWRTGNFLHSILEEEVESVDDEDEGLSRMEITPIICVRPRYRLFNPIDQGGGVLARADDGVHWNPENHIFDVKIHNGTKTVKWTTAETVKKSGLGEWGSSDPDDPNSPPAADLQYIYICNSPTHPHFGVFTILMQRSAIAAAKRFNSYVMVSEYNCYDMKFTIESVWDDKGANNKKFLWKIRPAGFVADENVSKDNAVIYEQFKDTDIGIHDEEANVASEAIEADEDDGEY